MRSTVEQCLLPTRALVLSLTERESLTVVLLVSEVIARPEFYLHYKSPPNTAGDAPNHRPTQATPPFVSLDVIS